MKTIRIIMWVLIGAAIGSGMATAVYAYYLNKGHL